MTRIVTRQGGFLSWQHQVVATLGLARHQGVLQRVHLAFQLRDLLLRTDELLSSLVGLQDLEGERSFRQRPRLALLIQFDPDALHFVPQPRLHVVVVVGAGLGPLGQPGVGRLVRFGGDRNGVQECLVVPLQGGLRLRFDLREAKITRQELQLGEDGREFGSVGRRMGPAIRNQLGQSSRRV